MLKGARCACRCPGFDPVQLCHLSRLKKLFLIHMSICNFDVPCTWRDLKVHLDGNRLTQLPGNLSQLTALTFLMIEDQESASLQITSPMHFLTQLQNLNEVHLGQNTSCWNPSSQFALMQGRLAIKNTPGCRVQMTE